MDGIFDAIYCINLQRCQDRRQHMIREFARIGVKNYQFLEAIDKTDPRVKKLMKSGKVFRYPPCFRCKRISCRHKNKKLMPSQVANWLSYQKVWRDIIRNKYQFCLICEDDLHFMKYIHQVVQQALTPEGRKRYGISLEAPTLIRLGWLKSMDHHFNGKIRIRKTIKWANPCHAINLAMARKLDQIDKPGFQIDCTSDGHIHNRVGRRFNHYTIFPPIAHELSFGKNAKFPSEIRTSQKKNPVSSREQVKGLVKGPTKIAPILKRKPIIFKANQ